MLIGFKNLLGFAALIGSSAEPDNVWSRYSLAQTLQGSTNTQKPGCKRLQVFDFR